MISFVSCIFSVFITATSRIVEIYVYIISYPQNNNIHNLLDGIAVVLI